MKWRRLQPGETDHELVWLGVSLAVAMFAFVWFRMGLPTPGCPFHALTGLPCPTCGMTRCARFLAQGAFGAALSLNPLACAAALVTGLFDLYAAVVLAFRLPRVRFEPFSPGAALVLRVTALAVILVNWAWLIRVRA